MKNRKNKNINGGLRFYKGVVLLYPLGKNSGRQVGRWDFPKKRGGGGQAWWACAKKTVAGGGKEKV